MRIAQAVGTMSSESDKEPEEEEGEYNFPHLSSGSSTGEETGNLFAPLSSVWNFLALSIILSELCKYTAFMFIRIIRGEARLNPRDEKCKSNYYIR